MLDKLLKFKMIDFLLYRLFGCYIINPIKRILKLKIKHLYYKVENQKTIVFSDDEFMKKAIKKALENEKL